jgi:hypothetical protein
VLVQASVVVVIEAAEQLSDSTHIMLYSTRWEYRDTPGGPEDRMILLVQYALCSGSLCQQSDTENGWLERQRTTSGMGGSCDSSSSDVWLDTTSQQHLIWHYDNSIWLIKCYSPQWFSITSLTSIAHIFHISCTHDLFTTLPFILHTWSFYYFTHVHISSLAFHLLPYISIGSDTGTGT